MFPFFLDDGKVPQAMITTMKKLNSGYINGTRYEKPLFSCMPMAERVIVKFIKIQGLPKKIKNNLGFLPKFYLNLTILLDE